MTDYIPITEAETDPEAPGTSSLWKRWWKNPIAMFEGAYGAPRLTMSAFEPLTVGDVIRSRKDFEQSASGSQSLVVAHVGIMQPGALRVRWEDFDTHYTNSTVVLRRYRAGSFVDLAVFNPTYNVWTWRAVDFPVQPGDLLHVILNGDAGVSGGAYVKIRNIRFSTGGANIWPGPTDAYLLENNYV